MAAGAGAFMVAEPLEAFAAGVTASTGENHGLYQNLNRISNDHHETTAIFDTLGGLVAEGLTGHAIFSFKFETRSKCFARKCL